MTRFQRTFGMIFSPDLIDSLRVSPTANQMKHQERSYFRWLFVEWGSPKRWRSTATHAMRSAVVVLVAILLTSLPVQGRPTAGPAAWKGFDTRDAQSVLHELGYDPGKVDGLDGPRTRQATRLFQIDHGIPATGELDDRTRESLVTANLEKSFREGSLKTPCSDTDASALEAHLTFVDFAVNHKWEVGRLYSFRTLMSRHYKRTPDPYLNRLVDWISHQPDRLDRKLVDSSPEPALLVYDHEDSDLRAWLITASGLRVYHHSVADGAELRRRVTQFRRALGIHDHQALRAPKRIRAPKRRGVRPLALPSPDATPLSMEEAITKLSALLFPANCANELRAITHLIVVPTSELWTVPFAVLKPFGDGTYLIEHSSVVMTPSLIDLDSEYPLWDRVQRSPSAVVVGNPSFPAVDSEWSYPPLPGFELEARAIAHRLGTSPFLGNAATKTNVIERSKTVDILYFATHGVADGHDPSHSSFLLLAGVPGKNSRWTLDEIQRIRFRASLVVLSGFQTGLGQVFDAGVLSVARGFHNSGVPRVAISLWNVDDNATMDLMVSFMDGIFRRKLYPPEALRAAMLATRERYKHPSKWASFTLFGALW